MLTTETLSGGYGLLLLAALAGAFVSGMLVLGVVLGPKKKSPVKSDPFECGTLGTGETGGRHSVKYYLVAMTFAVFDVEIVFLLAWAVNLRALGWPGFLTILPFLGLLGIGLFYEWRRGVLEI